MKKILWLSRHDLHKDQVDELAKIYGEVEIVQYDQSVNSWKEVVAAGKDCDLFAVVLPQNIVGELLNPRNNKKPVIRSVMERIPDGTFINPDTGKEENKFKFVHQYWEEVVRMEVVTKRLL